MRVVVRLLASVLLVAVSLFGSCRLFLAMPSGQGTPLVQLFLPPVLFLLVVAFGLRQVWRNRERRERHETGSAIGAQQTAAVPEPFADTLIGTVQGLHQRADADGTELWTFTLERAGSAPPVPVELRGTGARGNLDNGDLVELFDAWQPGLTIRPIRFHNRTKARGVVVRK